MLGEAYDATMLRNTCFVSQVKSGDTSIDISMDVSTKSCVRRSACVDARPYTLGERRDVHGQVVHIDLALQRREVQVGRRDRDKQHGHHARRKRRHDIQALQQASLASAPT